MTLSECVANLNRLKHAKPYRPYLCRGCKIMTSFRGYCSPSCRTVRLEQRARNKRMRIAAGKRKCKSKKGASREKIEATAMRLRLNIPRSEVWFQSMWERGGFRHPGDLYNHSLDRLIPDVQNREFKYVIEVDGSIHDSEKMKKRDAAKDSVYKKIGYRVFRVRAYSEPSFLLCADQISKIRNLK